MNSKRGTAERGFTLVELLAAVAVVGILAGIAYPSYVGMLSKVRRSEGHAALLRTMQQQERHYTLSNTYVAFSREAPGTFQWHSGETPQRSAYELSASACSGETLTTCVRLDALPGTDAVNRGATDPVCGKLSLDSRGVRTVAGDNEKCWR